MTVPVPAARASSRRPPCSVTFRRSTDELVVELATLALRLESDTGAPVDIECAVKGNDVYLLQSRPITTLRQAGAERSNT